MGIKSVIRALPVIGPLSRAIKPPRDRAAAFKGSTDYWEERYANGGNSGAGSYNRLAEFKAEVINGIVKQRQLDSVIEFGCGDGAQLALSNYPIYTGVDVSPTILSSVREKFAEESRFTFLHTTEVTADTKADLGLSLDVIYHLVEDDIFDTYMRSLFASSRKCVVIYASNKDAATETPHVRHRKFTDWIAANEPNWVHISTIANRYPFDPADPENTSFADFHVFGVAAW